MGIHESLFGGVWTRWICNLPTFLVGWLVGLLASLFPVVVEHTVQVPLTSYSLFHFLLGVVFSLCSIAAVLVAIVTIINIIAAGGVMMMIE